MKATYALNVNLIEYIPMKKVEFEALYNCRIPQCDESDGCRILYPDGGETWAPMSLFNKRYFPIKNATKIVKSDILRFFKSMSCSRIDPKTTLVSTETISGFTNHETSSCVDPNNYNHDLGTKYGLEKIVSKMWDHLGFILVWASHGLRDTSSTYSDILKSILDKDEIKGEIVTDESLAGVGESIPLTDIVQ